MQISSHKYKHIYSGLGINLDKLGCVMLDLASIQPDLLIPSKYDGEEIFYVSDNEDRFWINGWVANKSPHITLLYGLLQSGQNWALFIEEILEDWKIDRVQIEDIGYFESPYDDEEYYCVVAHIKRTPELIEGHQRLELLPHINTFTGYKPHMTLCYIKKDEVLRDEIIESLRNQLGGVHVEVNPKINLGK